MKNGLDSKCLFENKLFREKIIGIFLTVDSTSFRDLFRAKIELKNIMKYGFPYILIANKQDLPTALSIDEIRNQLNVPEDLPIVPTEAIKMQGFFKAFDLLLEMNLRQYHR